MNSSLEQCIKDGHTIVNINIYDFLRMEEQDDILQEVENTERCLHCNRFHNNGKSECNKRYRDYEKGKRDKGKNKGKNKKIVNKNKVV